MNLMNWESGGKLDYKEINKNIVRKLAQFPRLLEFELFAVIEARGSQQFTFKGSI